MISMYWKNSICKTKQNKTENPERNQSVNQPNEQTKMQVNKPSKKKWQNTNIFSQIKIKQLFDSRYTLKKVIKSVL